MAESLFSNDKITKERGFNKAYETQARVFSKIDGTMAILEKLPYFDPYNLLDDSFPFSDTPLGYLFSLLKTIGVTDEKIKEWILNILINVIPNIEIGVKAKLLSEMKTAISCCSDVRIPWWLRMPSKGYGQLTDFNIYPDEWFFGPTPRGVNIPIETIDPNGILNLSPFTSPGFFKYFGCMSQRDFDKYLEMKFGDGAASKDVTVTGDSNSRTARLTRAEDFNAFLWYTIHKGHIQQPYVLEDGMISGKTFNHKGKTYTISRNENRGCYVVSPSEGESDFMAGATFWDIPKQELWICYLSNYNEDGGVASNNVIPVSSNLFSCNWYVDKTNYYSKNLGLKEGKNYNNRDFVNEKALCNITYVKAYDKVPDLLHFAILPQPYVVLPTINVNESNNAVNVKVQPMPIRILFDAEGNPDKLGKYSFDPNDIVPSTSDSMIYNFADNGTPAFSVHSEGNYAIASDAAKNRLVECYPGLTLYEFNYDFIMGMKLFDPKVICQNILESVTNPYYNSYMEVQFTKTKNYDNYPYLSNKQRVLEIIKSILDEDEDEIVDCFYNFSNEKYDDMLRRTEEIVYKQLPYNQGYNRGGSVNIDSINEILMAYPDSGTPEEKKYVINRALESTMAILEDRGNITIESDKSTTKIDFLTNILQQLVLQLVDSIMSPKIMLIMAINYSLMDRGYTDKNFPINPEELMRAMGSVIKSVVREVRDLIMQKLLDYICEFLAPLVLKLQARMASEQFEHYMSLIRLLLGYYGHGVITTARLNSILSALFSRVKKNSKNNVDLPSVLDDVTYADITDTSLPEAQPIIGKC